MEHYRAIYEHLHSFLGESVFQEVYQGLAEVSFRGGTSGNDDFLDTSMRLVGDEIRESDIKQISAFPF